MRKPWIQISIDTQDIASAKKHVDIALTTTAEWIEAGTPLLTFAGIHAIAELANWTPGRRIVADFKALDGVGQYFRHASELGASVATVMAVANDASVSAAVQAAHASGIQVQADLLNIPTENMATEARRMEQLDVDFLLIHLGIDELLANPSADALAGLDEAVSATTIPVGPVVFHAEQGVEAIRRGASYVVIGYPLIGCDDAIQQLGEFEKAIRGAV